MGLGKRRFNGEVIWIIGASSGIGAALARELSAQGAVLVLSSRRQDRLDELNLSLGGKHLVSVLDVTDAAAFTQTAQAIHANYGRINRVIFLAAAYEPMKLDDLDLAKTHQIVASNLCGAFNAIQAILPLMKQQKIMGQIALCGSVAGYIGLPAGQPYSATKAAIINLAESLYAEIGEWVDVKLISPGFVRTPLTAKNNFFMPMMIEPEQAAMAIANGLRSSCFEIHFPKKFTLIIKLLRLLPRHLSLKLIRKLNP
ncbi:MAG: SDR family NAD(P)-dependent oxidoreductase [Candidatus Symbiobacter sp.]|nr:SDR family NAD(P)-dependent oxidoreductase [Candidatus Symbiobacter sp.]